MMKILIPVIGLIILMVLAYFTAGTSLVPTFPFVIACLQNLGVVPK